MLVSLIAIVILLILSGFFSGSETALTAASRALMHEMAEQGNVRAQIVKTLISKREKLIGSILLGNNLVNILASALATSVLIQMFGESGVAYATIVMTVMVLIFSEILPKTVAIRHANSFALAVAPIIRPMVFVLSPVIKAIQWVVRMTLKLFRLDRPVGSSLEHKMAELRGAIELHGGLVIKDERAMLRSVLDLNQLELGEIMTHRADMAAIDANLPPSTIVEQVLDSPYTRIPIWKERQDNIVGVIHAKQLLRAVHKHQGSLDDMDIMRVSTKPWFVPESTSLTAQLQAFRDRREHFALVVDEYGVLMGVVTLEDILEEIVGDIADEHDEAVEGVTALDDGSYLCDGKASIRDINRQLDWNLPDEDAATLAGFLLHESRTIPDVGQVFQFFDFRFKVTKRKRNQITEVQIWPVGPESVEPPSHG